MRLGSIRGKTITQEPHDIASTLLGNPLASFPRRMAGFFLDVAVYGVVAGCLFLGLTYLSIDREDPTFFPRVKETGGLVNNDPAAAEKRDQLVFDFLVLVDRRCPTALPCGIQEQVQQGSVKDLKAEMAGRSLTLGLGSGPTRMTDSNDQLTMAIGTDLLLGSFSSFASWGAFFVAWFTIWTRLGCGYTLGKKMLGMRVVRLDGKPLRWWDTFSRSGGYGASAATLFLGFVETIWHPNRQAMHDRIAGTVVIKT